MDRAVVCKISCLIHSHQHYILLCHYHPELLCWKRSSIQSISGLYGQWTYSALNVCVKPATFCNRLQSVILYLQSALAWWVYFMKWPAKIQKSLLPLLALNTHTHTQTHAVRLTWGRRLCCVCESLCVWPMAAGSCVEDANPQSETAHQYPPATRY